LGFTVLSQHVFFSVEQHGFFSVVVEQHDFFSSVFEVGQHDFFSVFSVEQHDFFSVFSVGQHDFFSVVQHESSLVQHEQHLQLPWQHPALQDFVFFEVVISVICSSFFVWQQLPSFVSSLLSLAPQSAQPQFPSHLQQSQQVHLLLFVGLVPQQLLASVFGQLEQPLVPHLVPSHLQLTPHKH
jgi:hypothetical protein